MFDGEIGKEKSYLSNQNTVEVADGQRSIEEGLKEIKTLLGSQLGEILPKEKEVIALSKEDFQSIMFRKAGYNYMKDVYGNADRCLYNLSFKNGDQTFITSGKISSGSPAEVGHAAAGGIDLRKNHINIYKYSNGHWEVISVEPSGIKKTAGEFGKPESVLPGIRQLLGKLVQIEHFKQPQK
jgi:hypothetical protein